MRPISALSALISAIVGVGRFSPGGSAHDQKLFAQRILQEAAATRPRDNIALSSLSLAGLLGVASRAASPMTARALADLLGLPVNTAPADAAARLRRVATGTDGALVVASALWLPVAMSVRPEFTTSPFEATREPLPVDPRAAAAAMNAWASAATRGVISNIADAGTVNTSVLILANAVYFKGVWADPFDRKYTVPRDFRAQGQPPTSVQMMRRTPARVPYWSSGDLEAARLRFSDQQLEYVMVTSRSRAPAEEVLEAIRAGGHFIRIISGEGFSEHEGVLEIPRHQVHFAFELTGPLRRMGLETIFNDLHAFSALTGDPLAIGSVAQVAVLKVDEIGAEAAAITSLLVTGLPRRFPRLHFVLDRPFVAFLANRDVPEWPVMMAVVRHP